MQPAMNLRKAIAYCLRRPAVAGLVLALAAAPTARAFLFEVGSVKGSFDTTISVGGLYRMQNPYTTYYGVSAGGLQRSVNADDGDLNYRRGIASLLVKASHDLLLQTDHAGLFVRGFYFNDFVNTNGARGRYPLSDEALKIVGETQNCWMRTSISRATSAACPPACAPAAKS